MEITSASSPEEAQVKLNLYKRASLLAQITIFYNLIEGIISVFFGVLGETLALFGFGIDSFEKARGESCHHDHPESS